MVIDGSALHCLNASFFMVVTVFGIVTLVILTQPKNAFSLISVTPSNIFALVRPEQPIRLNSFMLPGMVIDEIAEQPINA